MDRPKVAIVSAVTGNHDWPLVDRFYNRASHADHFYFKDDLSVDRGDPWWTIRFEEIEPDMMHLSPRLLAKLPKINPHRYNFLRQYDYVVWIDGGFNIQQANFATQMINFMGNNSLVLSPHFSNVCAYQEAEVRPRRHRSQEELIDRQVEFYKQEGFPKKWEGGMFEAGIEARKMGDPKLVEFEELWLEQVLTYSYRDQISLPYSLWKTGVKYSVLPKSFRDYNWVKINGHRS